MICFALITRNTSFLDNSNLCLTIFLTTVFYPIYEVLIVNGTSVNICTIKD